MIDLWPWFVMGIGIVALFVYRYAGNKVSQRSYKLHAPDDFQDEEAFARDVEAGDGIEIEQAQLEVYSARKILTPRLKASAKAIGHDWMPMAISLLVLLSALFVILSNNNYADAQQKWAFGAVGTILGYWFKR